MQADAQAVVEAFGKNEWVMKVIWALSVAIIGLVITKVLDPGVAQEWEKSDTGVCGIVGIDWTTSQKATKKIPDDNCWRLKKNLENIFLA